MKLIRSFIPALFALVGVALLIVALVHQPAPLVATRPEVTAPSTEKLPAYNDEMQAVTASREPAQRDPTRDAVVSKPIEDNAPLRDAAVSESEAERIYSDIAHTINTSRKPQP